MAAPKGNQFWMARSTHGRETIFSTPEILWEEACKYFAWCEENPIQDVRSFGQRKVQRPFTMQGLCRFLKVNSAYFRIFKHQNKKNDFNTVIQDIEDVVYQQKFEGAVIGIYKDNIIARDLGLVDKVEDVGGQKIKVTIKKKNAGD